MSLQPCGKDTKQRPEHRELWESGGLHTGPPAAGGHCGKLIAKRVIDVRREDLGMGCSAGMLRHAAPRHRSTATQHRDPAQPLLQLSPPGRETAMGASPGDRGKLIVAAEARHGTEAKQELPARFSNTPLPPRLFVRAGQGRKTAKAQKDSQPPNQRG